MPGPAPPLPPQVPAAPKVITRSLAVIVPEAAKVGDRLSFTTPAGAFSLNIPMGAMPGKSMNVSLPIPVQYPMHQPLTMTNIRLNNEPIPPKVAPELLALTSEHKQRVESHWGRFPNAERHRQRSLVDISQVKQTGKGSVTQQLGFWKAQRTAYRVEGAAGWAGGVLVYKDEKFSFGNATFSLVVQVRRTR